MSVTPLRLLVLLLSASVLSPARAQMPPSGVVSRARTPVAMDGKLTEWAGAFATPMNFGHADWSERAAVWRYLWDDEALFVGLECLDTTLFNKAPGPIYNGDAVEFYIDTREKPTPEWAPGALHIHYTAASNGEVKPRVQIRGGIPGFAGVTAAGMEAAAAKTETGYTLEFKLPWSKLGAFKPAAGKEIGLDVELCSSDGGPRVDRAWVYSSAAAVANPSVIGRVRLVDAWDPADAAAYSTVLFPSFLARSSPLFEPATLFLGISPALAGQVRKVELTASGRALPFVGVKRFGPGWERVQACLVGFTRAEDKELSVRLLGENDRVLGTRVIPLQAPPP